MDAFWLRLYTPKVSFDLALFKCDMASVACMLQLFKSERTLWFCLLQDPMELGSIFRILLLMLSGWGLSCDSANRESCCLGKDATMLLVELQRRGVHRALCMRRIGKYFNFSWVWRVPPESRGGVCIFLLRCDFMSVSRMLRWRRLKWVLSARSRKRYQRFSFWFFHLILRRWVRKLSIEIERFWIEKSFWLRIWIIP